MNKLEKQPFARNQSLDEVQQHPLRGIDILRLRKYYAERILIGQENLDILQQRLYSICTTNTQPPETAHQIDQMILENQRGINHKEKLKAIYARLNSMRIRPSIIDRFGRKVRPLEKARGE